MCDVDIDHGDTLNKKIRNAQLAQYNFILGLYITFNNYQKDHYSLILILIIIILIVVVGDKEKNANTVNIRTRDNNVHGEFSIEETIQRLQKLKVSKTNNSEVEFQF